MTNNVEKINQFSAMVSLIGSVSNDLLTLTYNYQLDLRNGTIDGGAGDDTLRLVASGLGYFDFTELSVFSGIEVIRSAADFTTIWIRDDQLLNVSTINGGDGFGQNTLGLEGTDLDLRSRNILNFDTISVITDHAVVTLVDKALALKVIGYGAQNDHLVLEGATFTEAERHFLHSHGVDKITDASGVVSINEAPIIANLDGNEIRTTAGHRVLLDSGSDAVITDDDGVVSSLSFRFERAVLTTESIEIDTTGSVKLSDGMFKNSVISIGDIEIGSISSIGNLGFDIQLRSGATVDLVNQLVRSIVYVNTSSDIHFAAHRNILIAAGDSGHRKGVAVVSVTIAQPDTIVLTDKVDSITGTQANEYVVAENYTLNAGDVIDGGAGFDTLRFSFSEEHWDDNDYDLTVLGGIRNIEKLEGTDADDTFHIDAKALTSLSILDAKGPSRFGDSLILHGHSLDLRGKMIADFETISFANHDVSLTIDNSSFADLISAQARDGIHIILEGKAFTGSQLSELFASGVDRVTDSKGTYTSYQPDPFPHLPPPADNGSWAGTNGNDAYTGTSAAEVLKGFDGKDTLDGGAGNDVVWGGLGNDRLKGGAGQDIFVFDTKPNKSSNMDGIADFKTKDDSIWLDNKVFTKLGKLGTESKPAQLKKDFFAIGSKAKDKNDYIIYDKVKGVLYYDADGSGKGKAVEVATLPKKLAMTYKDFFVI